LSLVGQVPVAAARGPFIAKLLCTHFSDKFFLVLSSVINRTIKNPTLETLHLGSSLNYHPEIAAVRAVPSGF
jgi:hypothetical protein